MEWAGLWHLILPSAHCGSCKRRGDSRRPQILFLLHILECVVYIEDMEAAFYYGTCIFWIQMYAWKKQQARFYSVGNWSLSLAYEGF